MTQDRANADGRLRRDLTTQQLLFISIGSIIGSGWLFAVLSASAVAGPAVILSWVIAGVLVAAMALNYAETATMLPRTGGIARYPYLTHGRFVGLLLGWALILGGVTTVSIEALGVVQYTASYVQGWWGVTLVETSGDTTALTLPGITASVGLMLLFFLVNAFGIRFLGRFNQWITWMKLIIPVLTFVLLFVAFHGSNLSVGAGFAPHGGGAVLNAVAVSGIIFAFQGFREGINFGGEARNPQRGIFVAAVASVAITAAVYILLQLAFVGAVNWASLGLRPGEWSGLETSVWASQPLYSALTASGNALLGAFGSVLLIDALISPTGSGWIYMGDGARAAYGMAAQGSLPRLFARVGRRTGVPWPGLVACLVLGCLFFVPFPGWYQLIGYTSATASLTYLAAGPQVLIMRRTAADLHRPFTLPAASLLSPLGFLAAGLVVYWAGFTVLRGVVASFFVAVAIYIAVQAPAQSRISRRSGVALGAGFLAAWAVVQAAGTVGWSAVPFPVFWTLCVVVIAVALAGAWRPMDAVGRRELRSSGWLLGFVMAIYLLSYYGSYGPAAQPALPFPYDTGIAAVITVGFFILAVRAGYETEDLRAERASVPIDPEPRARVGADI